MPKEIVFKSEKPFIAYVKAFTNSPMQADMIIEKGLFYLEENGRVVIEINDNQRTPLETPPPNYSN